MGLPTGYTDIDRDVSPEMLCPTVWESNDWELGIARLTEVKKNRVSRVKSLGNAVVPQCAFEAFKVIRSRYE